MDVDIQTEFVLDLNALVDLATDELLVLGLGELALGEFVSLDTDLLGLLRVRLGQLILCSRQTP